MIKQVYIPYWEWEDWVNGMWKPGTEQQLQEAVMFTGDHERYGAAMREVIEAWPQTMLNTITNQSVNRRAFLGHCAVCYKLGIPESVTRAAWKQLTDQQRYDADKQAQDTIDEYLKEYESRNPEIREAVATALLF